ncbi:hypothetical protein D043_4100B, partial [Vibrio parahaemolyticus EKP-021]
ACQTAFFHLQEPPPSKVDGECRYSSGANHKAGWRFSLNHRA